MNWSIPALILGALCALWGALQLKTSRPDGTLARVHPYRRMMPIIMPTRGESVVYFEHQVDASALLAYVEQQREALGCTVSHLMVAALGAGFHRHPRLNRFIAGQRVYQRTGVWLSFSMMRQKLDAQAKLATVKLEIPATMTLASLCEAVNAKIHHERSGEQTYLDREISIFLRLPHMVLVRGARLLFWANEHHLLPARFIQEDSMFTGAFIANLGSLGMDPGYHHLYEWGTCPLFVMVGQITEREVALPDGTFARRPVLPIRFTYDERVEDGLNAGRALKDITRILEDPASTFGPDGRQALGQPEVV